MAKVTKKKQENIVEKEDPAKIKRNYVLVGRVVSAKMPKTATVLVERKKVHPLYGKAFRRGTKYLVDVPSRVTEGDVVEIIQVKPISKNKHFQVIRIVGKDMEAIVTEQLKTEAAEEIAEVMPAEEEVKEAPSEIQESKESIGKVKEKKVEKEVKG